MYGELMDSGQGGREYEAQYTERLKEQWLDETKGKVCFYDWLDGVEPEEDEE